MISMTLTVDSARLFRHAICLVYWVRNHAWMRKHDTPLTSICRSIIGAALGGTLADPVNTYPNIFKPGGIFEKYPFLLPNLLCTAVVVCGLIVGILFLEETHEDKKDRRDRGLELGEHLVRTFRKSEPLADGFSTEKELLIHDEKPRGYASAEISPRSSSSSNSNISESTFCESVVSDPASVASDVTVCEPSYPSVQEKWSWRQGFTRQVILTIVGYGILAL